MDTTSMLRCASCGKAASHYTYLPANTLCDRQPYCSECAACITGESNSPPVGSSDTPQSFLHIKGMAAAYPLSPPDAGYCTANLNGYVHEPLGDAFSLLQGSEPGRELHVRVCRHCRCLYYCCEEIEEVL